MDLCRGCLSNHDLIELNEDIIFDYNKLTDLDVGILDGLPQVICSTCNNLVNRFVEFRNQTHSSEKILRTTIQNVKMENDELKNTLKLEKESEILSDSDATTSDFNDVQLLIVQKDELKTENAEHDYNDEQTASECDDITNDLNDPEFLLVERDKEVGMQPYRNLRKRKVDNSKIKKEPRKLKTKKINESKLRRKTPPKAKKSKKIKLEKTTDNNSLSGRSRTKIKPKTFQCGLCPAEFLYKKLLTTHVETHKGSKICMLCGKKFSIWMQMLTHRRDHLITEQKRCHICSYYRLLDNADIEQHYRIYHFNTDSDLTCLHCEKTFLKQSKLQYHIQTRHGLPRFFCDHCNKGFRCKSVLRVHLKKYENSKSYKCDQCSYSSNYNSGLKNHKFRCHTVGRVICRKCNRWFKDKDGYEKHNCYNPITICNICGEEQTQRMLHKHLMKHKPSIKRACPRCPAQFVTPGALKAHLDRHDNNRTHHCEYCPASFYTPSVLIKHRRTHTGEKPYACKRCGKAFTGGHNLKMHMRVHGEFLIKKKNKEEE